jgi:uncharacterized metal-binding protein YceD (DUF177 family)
MKVSVDDLKLLPQQQRFIQFKEVLKDLPTNKPVVGELVASTSASGFRLVGNVKTLLKLECDRCLKPYFQSISVDIDEKFVPVYMESDSSPPARDRELLKDDFVESLPESGIVDISDVVYQAVTLATPSYRLCGPECVGVPEAPETLVSSDSVSCASVEKEKSGERLDKHSDSRPIDPRWENLKTLFPKNDSQSNS